MGRKAAVIDRSRMIQMYKDGFTTTTICKMYKCGYATLCRVLREGKVKMRKTGTYNRHDSHLSYPTMGQVTSLEDARGEAYKQYYG